MGSDSPGQLMPFPYKPRSGRVINGDESELSSGMKTRRRGCNRLHHHGAIWQIITGHTKKGKVLSLLNLKILNNLCLENNKSCFITGEPGTGKTYMCKEFQQSLLNKL